MLEVPARYASVREGASKGGRKWRGGSEPENESGGGKGKVGAGSEVGGLLLRIAVEAGGGDMIRGLTMMSLEAIRRCTCQTIDTRTFLSLDARFPRYMPIISR